MYHTKNYQIFEVFNQPIDSLPGIGSALVKYFHQLNIHTVLELLLHLPNQYLDKSTVIAIAKANINQKQLLAGTITDVNPNQYGKLKFKAVLSDSTGQISLTFFKVYPSIIKKFSLGNHLHVFGEVKLGKNGLEISHPEIITNTKQTNTQNQLTAVYASVKGLSQTKIISCIKNALKLLQNCPDVLYDFYDNKQLLSLYASFLQLHQPNITDNIDNQTNPALLRIKLEELVAHQISLLNKKYQLKAHKAPRCIQKSPSAEQLLQNLPFSLTNAQTKVITEITNDIITSKPMLRLIQGDVGSGKTLVAALSACHAVDAGWQVALVAPTEILAEQHYENFKSWFEPLGICVGWLTGKMSAKSKKNTLVNIENNEVQIIIGTHALFQDAVTYAKLGLVIVDEQHRFGVAQRIAMREKGVGMPHQLVMTATPIPRTLAMSIYGEMDTSIIDELPPGRKPVTTLTISQERRHEVIERIASNCLEGKQAYWVCPLVEDSEALAAAAAQSTFEFLQDNLDISIGLVHGKMKADQKQAVMQKFANNDISLLVATTVIEVGVNVPNASLMVIENAERLGLSQLHQLRGRVGRGSEQSYCVLLYKKPLSANGQTRLGVMKQSNDGFFIAEQDLLIRGPGELVGKRQSGNLGFYVADLQKDEALIEQATAIAETILNYDNSHHTKFSKHVMDSWLPDKDYHNV